MSRTRPTENRPENPGKLPKDGTLDGAVPAGLSAEELRRRAQKSNNRDDGGTG